MRWAVSHPLLSFIFVACWWGPRSLTTCCKACWSPDCMAQAVAVLRRTGGQPYVGARQGCKLDEEFERKDCSWMIRLILLARCRGISIWSGRPACVSWLLSLNTMCYSLACVHLSYILAVLCRTRSKQACRHADCLLRFLFVNPKAGGHIGEVAYWGWQLSFCLLSQLAITEAFLQVPQPFDVEIRQARSKARLYIFSSLV
jgi:hypothetical protein